MDEIAVTLVRSIIAFGALMIFTRILGKQQVGQLTAFEYVAGITIGSIASSLSVDLSTKPLPQFLGLATWVILVYTMQQISIKFRLFSKVVDDQPTILIHKGKVLEQNLKKLRYRHDQLLSHLREKDIFDIAQVEFALLEPNGELSVQKKPQYESVTMQDLNLIASSKELMAELIIDGRIIEQNLKNHNKTVEWLEQQLKAQGVSDIKEISLGVLLPNGQLYIDKFADAIKEIDVGDYKGTF